MLGITKRELFSFLLLETLSRLFSPENGLASCMVTPQQGTSSNTGQPHSVCCPTGKTNQTPMRKTGGGGVLPPNPAYDSSAASKGGASSISHGGGLGSTPKDQVSGGASSNVKQANNGPDSSLQKELVKVANSLRSLSCKIAYKSPLTAINQKHFKNGNVDKIVKGYFEGDHIKKAEKELNKCLEALNKFIAEKMRQAKNKVEINDIKNIIKKVVNAKNNSVPITNLIHEIVLETAKFITIPPLQAPEMKNAMCKNKANETTGRLLIRIKNEPDRYKKILQANIKAFQSKDLLNQLKNPRPVPKKKVEKSANNPPK